MSEDLGSLIAKLAADLTDLKRGLLEGKADLAGFKQFTEEAAAKVKKVLSFAGISLGLYELASQTKEFGRSILAEGSRLEVLKASAESLGQYYHLSAEAIDFYIQKLKEKGVEEQKGYYAVNAFIKAGLSIDLLPQLAQAAKNLAPSMALPFNEAFQQIIQGIVKGTPKQLAEMVPGVKQALQAAASESKKLMDQAILSGPERAQIMLDYVMQAAERAKGVGDAVADSYIAKMGQYKRTVLEAKEALFAFVKPVSLAITGVEMQSWQDLYRWIVLNREQLEKVSEIIVVYTQKIGLSTKEIVNLVYEHRNLLKVALELAVISKVTSWLIAFGLAARSAAADLVTLATGVGLVEGAMGGWIITLAKIIGLLAAYGVYQTIKKPTALQDMEPGELGLLGEAWVLKGPSPVRLQPIPGSEGAGHVGIESPAEIAAKAKAAANAAGELGKELGKLPPGSGGKGGADDHLLRAELAMFRAQREEKLQIAQGYFDELKAQNNKQRAEEAKNLAEGLIDGRQYYQTLQDLQQQETQAALAMIERKRQAERQALADSLQELEADQKLSPEAKALARQKLEAENRKAMAKLDTEAAQIKLQGEQKVTEELTRQINLRQKYEDKTEDLNLETAQLLGAISEQEAKLIKLRDEWLRARRDAIKEYGEDPVFLRSLDLNYQAKVFDASPWGQKIRDEVQVFSNAFSDLASSIWDSGVHFSQKLDDLGKRLLKDTFKLFFDDLSKALTQGIRSLVASISQELQNSGGGFGEFSSGLGSWFKGLFGGNVKLPVSPSIESAHGNVFSQGVKLALAHGGVLTRPTALALAHGGVAVAGEAGYEGFLPLSRIGGDLGVKALLPGTGPARVTVVNNLGTEARATAGQDDNGDLLITLDQALAQQAARGSKLTQVLEARYRLNRRF